MVSCAALVALLAALLWHGLLLRRSRRKVPLVVHVGGTRGKTSTALTLASALEEQGARVMAKTTGSEPLLLLSGGRSIRVRRLGTPSIAEQEEALRTAARERVDVLIVECMAIRPEYIWASHALVLRPDLTIVTNTRPDHQEELGTEPGAPSAALSLLARGPGQLVFSSECDQLIELTASRSSIPHVRVETGDDPDEQVKSLVRAALEGLGRGSDRPVKVRGDAGTFRMRTLDVDGRNIDLADAFAANDPASLRLLWRRHASSVANVVVLAARRDRYLRTMAFLDALPTFEPPPTHVFVFGDPRVRRRGAHRDPSIVTVVGHASPRALWREVATALPANGLAWGVGNRVGAGELLLETRSG